MCNVVWMDYADWQSSWDNALKVGDMVEYPDLYGGLSAEWSTTADVPETLIVFPADGESQYTSSTQQMQFKIR